MPAVTPPLSPSPDPEVVDVPPLYEKRQHAMVLPTAREKRVAARTASRAVEARAQDQVKTVKTTNQDANSGKCVWIE